MVRSSFSRRLTKWEIACAIECLPGNTPWSASSLATVNYEHFTRAELVGWYNRLIDSRGLSLSHIS